MCVRKTRCDSAFGLLFGGDTAALRYVIASIRRIQFLFMCARQSVLKLVFPHLYPRPPAGGFVINYRAKCEKKDVCDIFEIHVFCCEKNRYQSETQ